MTDQVAELSQLAPTSRRPATEAGDETFQAPATGAVGAADGIAGLSALKGLIVYAATLAFAGVYCYFIVRIFAAHPGRAPVLDATVVSAAAGLAGVLGSAFALEIGSPTRPTDTNPKLAQALEAGTAGPSALGALWRVLSLEPASTQAASWPKTFGIWTYAVVATAVAATYIVNQGETPNAIKGLAVAFAGYVIALINAAYHGKGD
jgi:hypothetical protein